MRSPHTSADRLDATLVRRYAGAYTAHDHAHAQVLIGLTGSLELEVEGHYAFVDAACGLVIPAGARHGYFVDGTASVLVLDCEAGRGTERFRRFAVPSSWRDAGAPPTVESVFVALGCAPTLQVRRRIDLQALAREVEEQLSREWTVAQLAALCNLSPQRFRARFAELTGTSPLAYVRHRRLEAAQRLLRKGWTLDAVALQVGYASASALSYALRRDRATGARELRQPLRPGRASLES
jgi:AraC-like DNA-binding protein